jgi:hypothetical protein
MPLATLVPRILPDVLILVEKSFVDEGYFEDFSEQAKQ